MASAYWALAAVCFFWGTTYIAIRMGVRDVPPFIFAGVRFGLAALLALAIGAFRKGPRPKPRDWKRIAWTALVMLTAGNGTLSWASQWVPAGIASLIVVTTPFWMVGFGRFAGETVRPRAWAGLIIGFIGLIVLLWPDLRVAEFGSGFLLGSLALSCSSASWGYGAIYTKRKPIDVEPWTRMGLQCFFASVYLFSMGFLRGEQARWNPTPEAWAAIIYLVIFGSIVGYGCFVYCLERLPTEQSSIYAYVNPIVAVGLGAVMLGEPLTPNMIMATPLVLWGVWLVNTGKRPTTEPELT